MSVWDTLAPPASSCTAEVKLPRKVAATCINLVPGTAAGAGPGALLLVGDDSGGIGALDVRMMAEGQWVWQEPKVHKAGVTGLASWDVRGMGRGAGAGVVPWRGGVGHGEVQSAAAAAAGVGVGTLPMQLSDVVVSGGKDGALVVLNVHTGSPVQVLEAAHYVEKRGLLGGRSARVTAGSAWDQPTRRPRPVAAVAAAVTGVSVCAEGVVSCGADGVVRLHPLGHLGY